MNILGKIFLTIVIVALSAGAGAAILFFGLIFVSIMLGASTMEGGLAMGAAGLMPLGGLGGAIMGLWISWQLSQKTSGRAMAIAGFIAIAFVGACIGGWFIWQDRADGDPYASNEEPIAHIEWRLPELFPHDKVVQTFRYSARSTFKDWTLTTHWDDPVARDEDGHTIIRIRAFLRWRRDGRQLQLWRWPNHDDRITTDAGLPDDPPFSEEYGPWKEVASAPGYAFRIRVDRD